MLYSVQQSRQEMIDCMERMLYELLAFYREQNNGKLPSKIFYYRDGVSEGQYAQVQYQIFKNEIYNLITRVINYLLPFSLFLGTGY